MRTTRYLLVALLAVIALGINARTFYKGEEIYVNVQQSDEIGDWSKDGAKIYLYFFEGSNKYEWLELQKENGSIYKGTISSERSYPNVIVVRGAAPNWESKYDQSPDMEIPDEWNCINKFYDAANRWAMYSPATSKVRSYTSSLTADEIHICPNALGYIIALRPKLNADTTNYIYNLVTGHEWYVSTDGGNTWNAKHSGHAGVVRTENDHTNKDLFETLPASLPPGGRYYYLHSSIPEGRHLILIKADATKCELDCSITAFETAVSAVNADDNTYTLDGMVAFDDAQGMDLVVECDGHSVTIANTELKSPQSFSLHGVPAATTDGVTTTATAYFVLPGSTSHSCEKSITIKVPNATAVAEVVKVDSLTGKQITLTPKDYDPNNTYVWMADGQEIVGAPQVLVLDAFEHDSNVVYTYKEYFPPVGSMDDLMKDDNGKYEAESGYGTYGMKSTMSDYDFWGRFTSQINFYADTLPGSTVNPLKLQSNGFAVVRNANEFAPTYANVTAHQGSQFALFDAATGSAGGDKMAWYAETTNNPDLKLKAGMTYVLSFRAANINNYGEMDNAARFQFIIEDITNPSHPDSLAASDVLDLSKPEYRNNMWHQCSKTYTAKADCDKVRISVVNLNKRKLIIGNDFALDDIQFHPISSVSRVVKSQQQFDVTAHEPKVTAFTAEVQPVECDSTDYTIKMHIEYQNPNSQLVLFDVTTGHTHPLGALPAIGFDQTGVLEKDTVITTKEDVHIWNVYFEEWRSAVQQTRTPLPGFPSIDTAQITYSNINCVDVTTSLTFDLKYRFQQGKLTYWVDNLPKQEINETGYNARDTALRKLPLTIEGIPSDGKNNHVLHISFDGANSCIKDYALPQVPFSPVIRSVAISGVATTVPCGAQDYTVTVTIQTAYDATGRNLVLSYDDNGAQSQTVAGAGKSTTAQLTLHNIEGAAQTIWACYEEVPGCTIPSINDLLPPTRESCVKDEAVICEGEDYFWERHNQRYTVSELPVGVDTFAIGSDSLFVTVNAVPHIAVKRAEVVVCDDERQVRIPISILNGQPSDFSVEVNGSQETGVLDIAGDTALIFPLNNLAAGDYSAAITSREAGALCTSQVVRAYFTVSISGQMYSKWTDVLFINNKDGLYEGYQWYEDGKEMEGEILQRLYNPNGLPGVYYCRLLTKDGRFVTTCPQAFDEVKPSRNENTTPQQVRATTTYDTMGRPISNTLQKGIYIVFEEMESGETRARKIAVYE
ncbi:MAG: hypothetical protein II901_00645 [Paludibacteraceae bacterium]|nr:hypothetical protein [Paludibacteraceae bacterium]